MTDFEWIVIVFFLALLFGVQILGYVIAKNIFHPYARSLEDTRNNENEVSPGLMDLYDSWSVDRYRIKTSNKTEIQIYDVTPYIATNKFVVIAHGYTYTHHGAIKYAKMFMNLGFHVIMFDQRFHGASEGKNCTLGGYEKTDLYDVITEIFARYTDNIYLGTFGESMGAATVLMESEIDKRVHFVGSDCSFSDLETLATYLIHRKIKLPKWPFIPLANLYFRLFTGLSFKQISPIESVKKSTVPIFYAHGLEDKYILPTHTQLLFDATSTYKVLFWGENNSKHAGTARKNEAQYYEALKSFIETVLPVEEIKQEVKS